MPRLTRLAFVTLLAAGALTACGKRGHLEPPPGQKTETGEARPGEQPPAQTKLGATKRTPITPPKRALIIDSILE